MAMNGSREWEETELFKIEICLLASFWITREYHEILIWILKSNNWIHFHKKWCSSLQMINAKLELLLFAFFESHAFYDQKMSQFGMFSTIVRICNSSNAITLARTHRSCLNVNINLRIIANAKRFSFVKDFVFLVSVSFVILKWKVVSITVSKMSSKLKLKLKLRMQNLIRYDEAKLTFDPRSETGLYVYVHQPHLYPPIFTLNLILAQNSVFSAVFLHCPLTI